ncbi:MarR family winged helix-turn-helix transcriptional regulator [Pectinatus sottacetonis]|uniref:MarR family winged helix-turn-helix transcriptional regulator n=1 Tax=Pectinatus sottacetonis TaxID=1002795 RepID=UPI001E35A1AE|nr:MarR family winged helix-turn-helix transcriptional regulator [Pectinatus sottacetonis]
MERIIIMEEEKLNELHMMIHRLSSLRERFFYHVNDNLLLPPGQSRVIRFLSEYGAIRQNELAEKLAIRPGSLSELLGKLVKNEYIEKITCLDDKRKIIVRLTKKGRETSLIYHAAHLKFLNKMFAILSDTEFESLCKILTKLVKSWEILCKTELKNK